MTTSKPQRILVTGGNTYTGISIAAALLADGAEVTLLIRPGTEDRLGPLEQRVRWFAADIWDSASLRGRARGHRCVIHTVGSMIDDPKQGLTYHRLNVISARNAVNMCISDGVPRMVLLSTVSAPWVKRQYVRAKREAETYIARVGVEAAIVRAPLTYGRGQPRSMFYRLMTLLGSIPPLSWTLPGRIAPMPLDMLARGVARIALMDSLPQSLYFPRDVRRLNKREERRGTLPAMLSFDTLATNAPPRPVDILDEDTPFGWTPPTADREQRF
jgi:uncharacterized protein YbjT (DUF2867 family)